MTIREKIEKEQWQFITDWCKAHGVSPMLQTNYNRARMEWIKQNCFKEKTCATTEQGVK